MTSSPDGDHSSGMAPRHVRKENGENDVFKSRPRRTKKPARRSADWSGRSPWPPDCREHNSLPYTRRAQNVRKRIWQPCRTPGGPILYARKETDEEGRMDGRRKKGTRQKGRTGGRRGRTKKPARRSALDVFDQELCLNECVDSGCGESCYDDESNYIADNLESLHPSLTAPAHCLEH